MGVVANSGRMKGLATSVVVLAMLCASTYAPMGVAGSLLRAAHADGDSRESEITSGVSADVREGPSASRGGVDEIEEARDVEAKDDIPTMTEESTSLDERTRATRMPPHDEECGIGCGRYGECVSDVCDCESGFYGDHCEIDFLDVLGDWYTYMKIFFIVQDTLVALYGLYLVSRIRKYTRKFRFSYNTQSVVLTFLVAHVLFDIVYQILTYNMINSKPLLPLLAIVFGLQAALVYAAYTTMVLFWAEIGQTAAVIRLPTETRPYLYICIFLELLLSVVVEAIDIGEVFERAYLLKFAFHVAVFLGLIAGALYTTHRLARRTEAPMIMRIVRWVRLFGVIATLHFAAYGAYVTLGDAASHPWLWLMYQVLIRELQITLIVTGLMFIAPQKKRDSEQNPTGKKCRYRPRIHSYSEKTENGSGKKCAYTAFSSEPDMRKPLLAGGAISDADVLVDVDVDGEYDQHHYATSSRSGVSTVSGQSSAATTSTAGDNRAESEPQPHPPAPGVTVSSWNGSKPRDIMMPRDSYPAVASPLQFAYTISAPGYPNYGFSQNPMAAMEQNASGAPLGLGRSDVPVPPQFRSHSLAPTIGIPPGHNTRHAASVTPYGVTYTIHTRNEYPGQVAATAGTAATAATVTPTVAGRTSGSNRDRRSTVTGSSSGRSSILSTTVATAAAAPVHPGASVGESHMGAVQGQTLEAASGNGPAASRLPSPGDTTRMGGEQGRVRMYTTRPYTVSDSDIKSVDASILADMTAFRRDANHKPSRS
eukprot:GFYU01010261.1.p1 GENE.GFYU01010261.1~~GFYU01010261.1.p1  ORF type:complete len:764 (+),score=142.84 GFYU01010261.1:179-2470(+)